MRANLPGFAVAGVLALLGTGAARGAAPAGGGAPREPSIEEMLEAIEGSRRPTPVEAADYSTNAGMQEALQALAARRDARRAAIEKRVGTDVALFTTKGKRKGRLVAFADGALVVEQVFVINGQPRGSTRFTVPLDQLTPASLERLAPAPAPTTPVEWAASVLEAMAASDLDAADAAVARLRGHPLGATLAADVARIRKGRREAEAREAWARIKARAEKATSQARAKQLIEDLAAFRKAYADTEFAAATEVALKAARMKEEFDRLALGLDPRVARLFKGRVLTYDPRTQVISLGYGFATREETEDFIGSVWAPPGDHTGLTWRKGELRTFCKGTADRILRMPQFLAGTLTVRFGFRRIDTSRRNRFQVEIAFYGMESTGATEKVMYRASEKGHFLLGKRSELTSNLEAIPFREDGIMELVCQRQSVVVKENGKVMLKHMLPKANDHTGFWIGGGWDSGITFTRLEISGRLDPAWLAAALARAPKAR
ncbi:MAG: hypothetical protein ACYSU0_02200 [Planctomycetota bacterium]